MVAGHADFRGQSSVIIHYTKYIQRFVYAKYTFLCLNNTVTMLKMFHLDIQHGLCCMLLIFSMLLGIYLDHVTTKAYILSFPFTSQPPFPLHLFVSFVINVSIASKRKKKLELRGFSVHFSGSSTHYPTIDHWRLRCHIFKSP